MNFLAFFTINRQEVFLVKTTFGKKPSKNPRKSSTKTCDFQTDKFSRSAILALIKSLGTTQWVDGNLEILSRKNTKKKISNQPRFFKTGWANPFSATCLLRFGRLFSALFTLCPFPANSLPSEM